ncbi:MAG: hypothetical protein ACRD1V_15285, partial [Vicinamibacterales bacterium]
MLAFAAALLAALGAWLPWAAISFADSALARTGAAARVGILPIDVGHLSLAGAAAAVVLAIAWRRDRSAAVAVAVSPLLLLLLPWLPFHVPTAFDIWQGPLASLIWCAVAAALAAIVWRGGVRLPSLTPRAATLTAGALAVVICSIAAWGASASIPGGDEPHYLIITQSLLYDRDLKIENNHQHGDYHAYFAGDLPPDFVRRGRNGAIYSIHAPGVSALVLPAFALGGYPAVVLFLIAVAAAASMLAWWLAWRVTADAAAAWFGWAAVTLSAPFLLDSFTVYPDGPGEAVVLTGFWALLRAEWEEADPSHPAKVRPWFLHGLALALLPWLHTRFSVLAATIGGLVLVRLARTPNPVTKAIAFLSAPAVSAIAWMLFFMIIYGTPDPTAPYGGSLQSSFAFVPDGLGGLLFDQGFGMLATAPVLLAGLIGLFYVRRLALDWVVTAFPYLLSVTTFAMWWAGWSAPARFVLVLTLPLAIPAAVAWAHARSRGWRTVRVASLVATAWLSAVMAGGGGGRLGFHTRNEGGMTPAPWLSWGSDVVDLPAAGPAFVPLPNADRAAAAREGFVEASVWAVTGIAAILLLVSFVDRRRRGAPAVIAATTVLGGIAVMCASTIVWAYHGVDAITPVPAQLDALRMMPDPHVLAIDLASWRRLPARQALAITIELPVHRARRDHFGARGALAQFPVVPAGTYRVSVKRHCSGDGLMMLGVANDQFALLTEPIGAFEHGLDLTLPAGARTLTMRADEQARDEVEAVDLQPVSLEPHPLTGAIALHAVRYDAATVFFLDDRAFPEPSAFWVGGARATDVVIASSQPRSAQTLVLRNAPVPNTVTLQSGSWHEQRSLGPGEEWHVELPLDPRTGDA